MDEAEIYAQAQRESMDDVVNDYLPLVKKIGMLLVARLPGHIELDDLLQVGLLGLLQAKESYDSSHGASFGTYAAIRIKGAMLDEVRRNDWAPRSVQQKMRHVSLAIKELEASLGRPASDAEIAESMGMTLEEYHDVSRELVGSRLTSLDEMEEQFEGDDFDPSSYLEDEGFRDKLQKTIGALPETEMLMMSLYYGDGLNLKEVGEVLGVSESRVSQIHGQALARVRSNLSEWIG